MRYRPSPPAPSPFKGATLDDQWETWVHQAAFQTTDPPVAGAPTVVSPLALWAALLRWVAEL